MANLNIGHNPDPRIAFCTTCKGRLFHLEQTLLPNLTGNPRAEFVVMNYDSPDGLDDWMRDKFSVHIASGEVRYGRLLPGSEPRFRMSHAKNTAHLLATADFVINCDADCHLRPGLADWIYDNVKEHHYKVVADAIKLWGFVGTYRDVFSKVLKGYDETMENWGYDDDDMFRRARSIGCEKVGVKKGEDRWNIGHRADIRRKFMPIGSMEEGFIPNKEKMLENHAMGIIAPNTGKRWGIGKVEINFSGQFIDMGENG